MGRGERWGGGSGGEGGRDGWMEGEREGGREGGVVAMVCVRACARARVRKLGQGESASGKPQVRAPSAPAPFSTCSHSPPRPYIPPPPHPPGPASSRRRTMKRYGHEKIRTLRRLQIVPQTNQNIHPPPTWTARIIPAVSCARDARRQRRAAGGATGRADGARGPFCCCHISSRRARSFLLLSYIIPARAVLSVVVI